MGSIMAKSVFCTATVSQAEIIIRKLQDAGFSGNDNSVLVAAGAFIGMGIHEFEAKIYEGKVKSGSCLLSVRSEDSAEARRAKEIFERAGAKDITTAGEVAAGDQLFGYLYYPVDEMGDPKADKMAVMPSGDRV